jgi:hypothetical protein
LDLLSAKKKANAIDARLQAVALGRLVDREGRCQFHTMVGIKLSSGTVLITYPKEDAPPADEPPKPAQQATEEFDLDSPDDSVRHKKLCELYVHLETPADQFSAKMVET